MTREATGARINERPADLPDYAEPPLVEVVIDAQFAAIPGYKQIHAAQIWKLFRDGFPNVEEHPPLAPSFETFGLPSRPQFNVKLSNQAMPARLWFVGKRGDHLIQFQPDRFIRNWRKHHDHKIRYPRFETILESFEQEFSSLSDFVSMNFAHSLGINQCEVRYVNHIPINLDGPFKTEDYFKFGEFGIPELDDFNVKVQRTIKDKESKPLFRVGCECGPGMFAGNVVVRMEVFARGAPEDTSLQATINFCLAARTEIVRFFTDVTTDNAHGLWGRRK